MNAFGELTDKEFKKLQKDIEKTLDKLEKLQAIHRKETGQDYVKPFFK